MAGYDVKSGRTYVIKLNSGVDILEGLEQEIKKAGIKNGVILVGIGSTTCYHIHVVKTTNLPPGNVYFKKDEPFDVVNMQGYIFDGRIHGHISLSDAKTGSQFGGHLEPGCKVLTFCVITILETDYLGELDSFNQA